MIMDYISLDGRWDFSHSLNPSNAKPEFTRTIQVPGVWQAQFADLRMRAGIGWYCRAFELPPDWIKGQIWLRFGAVFHTARVWVNGVAVGEHEGGFLPFAFDITAALLDGVMNEIAVRVESPTDDRNQYPESPLTEIPFGKQSWYGPQSGIWQSVALERRDYDHVARVQIMPDLGTGQVRLSLFLAQPANVPIEAEINIHNAAGDVVAASLDVFEQESDCLNNLLHVADVRAWSPDQPNLYSANIVLRRNGKAIDHVREPFGFRTIETKNGRFYLNGEPLYLRAALDQDYYPDTLCTIPSAAFLEDQFRKVKELGLNCIRCHIKVPDPRYYEVADRVGLLIWTELPNSGYLSAQARTRAETTLKAIVDRDSNHPSIICWTIINENWGTDLVHNADHRAWLKQTYDWLKAYDPTRLVVDNSPLAPSGHVQTDIADFHFYAAIPDHRANWDQFVVDLANRPAWLFCGKDDVVTTGAEPLMCSEFGNWGLPQPNALADESGHEPWWFESGHDWGDGVMYAHGIQNRFVDWSLDRVFGSLHNFVEAAQWQQFRALKYQIEAMRRQPTLAGYVITELTDCHWEANGLLDMRRNPRIFHDVFKTINADTVIVPCCERRSYWAGEKLQMDVAVAHGAGASLRGATLDVFLGEAYSFPVPMVDAGDVADLGMIELDVPNDSIPHLHRMTFELRTANGAIIANNHMDIAVQAKRMDRPGMDRAIWSSNETIRNHLVQLGYQLAEKVEEANLIIATAHDQNITAHVQAGGRLLLLPESEGSLTPFFPHWQNVKVQSREGTMWCGDWASSFAWLNRSGAFAELPGQILLDETFDRVIPTHVISGCNLLDFQARVHAGLVVGWVHKPVALAVEQAYGHGHLVASTFRLFRDQAGADPTATVLLDRLITLSLGPVESRRDQAPALQPAN